MNRLLLVALFGLFSLTPVSEAQKLDEPPSAPPASCSTSSYVWLLNEEGTDSFHLLHFEIKSLTIAHEANATAMKAVTESSSESPQSALATLLLGSTTGQEGYSCAAYIMGQLNPKDDNEASVRSTYIASYNILSSVAEGMKDRLVKKIKSQADETKPDIQDAQEFADLMKARNDAISMIVDATNLSLMMARTTGSNSNVVDTWKLSCKERKVLIDELEPYQIEKANRDAFEKIARMIRTLLVQKQKCS
jgi:hypothetical protein